MTSEPKAGGKAANEPASTSSNQAKRPASKGQAVGSNKKRKVDKKDDSEKKDLELSLLPKDHVPSDSEQLAREKHMAMMASYPGALKSRGEEKKNDLLRLYQAGFLDELKYDQLGVLENGDIGLKNGQPLNSSRRFDSERVLSKQQLEQFAAAIDNLPPIWHIDWADLAFEVRKYLKADRPLQSKELLSLVLMYWEIHLTSLLEYLKLIQPWNAKPALMDRRDFRGLWEDLSSDQSVLGLFGIRTHLRDWQPNIVSGDMGIRHDVCGLKGGVAVASAIEALMRGNNPEVDGRDDKIGAWVVECFRELLHYYERDGSIDTGVETAFRDVGTAIRLSSLLNPWDECGICLELLGSIQSAYESVKKSMDRNGGYESLGDFESDW